MMVLAGRVRRMFEGHHPDLLLEVVPPGQAMTPVIIIATTAATDRFDGLIPWT